MNTIILSNKKNQSCISISKDNNTIKEKTQMKISRYVNGKAIEKLLSKNNSTKSSYRFLYIKLKHQMPWLVLINRDNKYLLEITSTH